MPDGMGTAISSLKSQCPGSMNPSMQRLTSGDVILERGHALGERRGVEDAPVTDVIGGIDLQRDQAVSDPR